MDWRYSATMDMTPYLVGMINKKEEKGSVSIVMGNKQVEKSVAIGDILSMVCDNQGNQVMGALMKDVTLVPDCTFNCFSISKHLKEGWKLGGHEDALILMSPDGKYIIKFNITISTPNGKLYAICIMWTQQEVTGVVTTNSNLEKQVVLTVHQVQERLGHINERSTKEIAEALGWKLADAAKLNCSSCAAGKAKQKSFKKVLIVDPDNEKEGYRAYLDLSTIKKNEKYPYSRQSKLAVDCCWNKN